MKLSKLQEQIINDPVPKSVVMASAAAGKTRCLTEKVRMLLRQGVDPRRMAVITFTNMAAAEMRKRLGEDYKDGLFVGTIHSLANHFLLSSGIPTDKILNDEDFDQLFKMVEEHPECVKMMDWVLLDEAQDSSEDEFQFILGMINPTNFQFYGDLRQCIYQFKGSRPDLLLRVMRRNDVKVFDLNENYRNGYNILSFAQRIIRPILSDSSRSMRLGENGAVHEMQFSLDTIYHLVTEDENYGEWAILTRTNAESDTICAMLKKREVPIDSFKQGDLKKEELDQKMNENTVKVLTIHSSKGLEWNKVIVVGARFSPEDERNVCYVAATRARDLLVWMNKKQQKVKMRSW